MILGLEQSRLRQGDAGFDADCEATVAWLTTLIRLRGNSTTVLSHEGFLRCTRYGEPKDGVESIGHDVFRTAERLQQVFGPAAAALEAELHVLIVVRSQLTMLPSYHDFFHDGEDWPKFFHECVSSELRGFARTLLYDEVVARYQALFGVSRTHVLPFELLGEDSSAFLAQVAQLAGIDPEEAVRLASGSQAKRSSGARRHHLQAAEQARIRALYAESNVRLAQRCHLDLAAYRYPMGPDSFPPAAC